MADEVRIDKFLWAIRAFKTRSEAADACKGNKVKVNTVDAKPARMVKVGDVIEITFGQRTLKVEVLNIAEHVLKNDASALYREIP